MIKNRIIELDNGINYYILEEVFYEEKKYCLAVECDLEKDEVNENDLIVMEVKIENQSLATSNIEDDNLAMIVTGKLLEKFKTNKDK